MAGQTEVSKPAVVHGGVSLPFNVMAYSLSDAICQVGIPSMEIGLAAVAQGLAVLDSGEGMPHFHWNKKALDKHGVKFLETMLMNLRQASGVAETQQ
jgi:hypothetical protein